MNDVAIDIDVHFCSSDLGQQFIQDIVDYEPAMDTIHYHGNW